MQRYEDLFILANFLKEKGSFGIPFLVIFIENGTPNSNLWVFFAVIQRIMYIFALYLPTPCHRKDGPQCLIDDGGHLAEVRIYGWYTTLCKSVIDALFWADRNLRNFFQSSRTNIRSECLRVWYNCILGCVARVIISSCTLFPRR